MPPAWKLAFISPSFGIRETDPQYSPSIRIILIDGEPVGAINRIPSGRQIRANLHIGGKAIKANLSSRDLEICNEIKLSLKEKKLFFTGIDIIDNYLTEINVTSPTGIKQINTLNNVNLEKVFWDKLEAKYKLV